MNNEMIGETDQEEERGREDQAPCNRILGNGGTQYPGNCIALKAVQAGSREWVLNHAAPRNCGNIERIFHEQSGPRLLAFVAASSDWEAAPAS
jgi:hypothetical protein